MVGLEDWCLEEGVRKQESGYRINYWQMKLQESGYRIQESEYYENKFGNLAMNFYFPIYLSVCMYSYLTR